jgi:outer membrane protein
MKNILLVLALMVTTPAFAVKMGKVDVQKVLVTIKESAKVRDKLKAEFDKKQQEIRKEEEKLVKERQSFEKQALVMNDSAKAKKGQELQKKFLALQQKMQQYQGEMQQMEQKFKAPILKKIRTIVEKISKSKGLDFTYESGTTPLLYAKGVTDITPDVIKAYDKENK